MESDAHFLRNAIKQGLSIDTSNTYIINRYMYILPSPRLPPFDYLNYDNANFYCVALELIQFQ